MNNTLTFREFIVKVKENNYIYNSYNDYILSILEDSNRYTQYLLTHLKKLDKF